MEEKKIAVVGNGLDLACGKKTAYTDFIARVEEAFQKEKDARSDTDVRLTELCNRNGFFRHFHFLEKEDETWSDFEREMGEIVAALARFCDVVAESQRNPEFDLLSFNIIPGLFTYAELQVYYHFARIFEQVFDDPSGGMYKLQQQFITAKKTLNKKALRREVEAELATFSEALDLYLADCPQEITGQEEIAVRLRALLPDLVINFNYTDTPERCGLPRERIFYAKGRAGHDPRTLVLGCPGGAAAREDWLFLDNDFQKLVKDVGWPDERLLYPTDAEGRAIPVTVRYFGYSFPEGDAELITELWEAAAYTIIDCRDPEDYAKKMVRLFSLFGKERVREAISRGRLSFSVYGTE